METKRKNMSRKFLFKREEFTSQLYIKDIDSVEVAKI